MSADDVVAHPAIAAELLAMGDADQAVREAPIDTKAMRDMDHRHLDRMRAIVDAIGWPTRSKVGERAEHLERHGLYAELFTLQASAYLPALRAKTA